MLDVWHRPGNVHDSNGARSFIVSCLSEMRQILGAAVLEVRMECAFFSDEISAARSCAASSPSVPANPSSAKNRSSWGCWPRTSTAISSR